MQISITAIFVLLFGWFIIKNWLQIQKSFDLLVHGPHTYIWVALPFAFFSFVAAAVSYQALALRKLSFPRTLLVEFAAATLTRLLPAGLGGMGAHALYLHKSRHTTSQAASVVGVNNILGFITHSALLVAVLLFSRASLSDLNLQLPTNTVVIAAGFIGAIGLLLLLPASKKFLQKIFVPIGKELAKYAKAPYKILLASGSLALLTLCNVAVLYLASHAIAPDVFTTFDFGALFIIYSMGVFLGSLVPTPGGLAGVEAGLVAGFMAYGLSTESSIASALAFRLVTYWLPLVPGVVALVYARKKKYL